MEVLIIVISLLFYFKLDKMYNTNIEIIDTLINIQLILEDIKRGDKYDTFD